MGFYERLETLRKNVGIGQGKLEKELEIANGSISKWKNRTPKYGTLVKIATYFNVTVDYLIYGDENESQSGDTEKTNGIIKSTPPQDVLNYVDLFSGVGGLRNALTPTSMCIQFVDEPEIHMHSKTAYELVKEIAKMKDTDVSLLLDMAKRLNPTENVIPFPQYPTVTNKDIDEFAARNAKKKFTREEIAEMLYEMKQEDE